MISLGGTVHLFYDFSWRYSAFVSCFLLEVQCICFMISLGGTVHAEEEESCVVLGMGLGGLTYQPVQQLAKITNFEYRMQVGEMPWWMKIRPTMRILAQHKPSVGEEAKNIWIANDLADLMSKYDAQR